MSIIRVAEALAMGRPVPGRALNLRRILEPILRELAHDRAVKFREILKATCIIQFRR